MRDKYLSDTDQLSHIRLRPHRWVNSSLGQCSTIRDQVIHKVHVLGDQIFLAQSVEIDYFIEQELVFSGDLYVFPCSRGSVDNACGSWSKGCGLESHQDHWWSQEGHPTTIALAFQRQISPKTRSENFKRTRVFICIPLFDAVQSQWRTSLVFKWLSASELITLNIINPRWVNMS